jgi:hypothetical protein
LKWIAGSETIARALRKRALAVDLAAIQQAAAQGSQAAVAKALDQFADAVLSRVADDGTVAPNIAAVRAAFLLELGRQPADVEEEPRDEVPA